MDVRRTDKMSADSIYRNGRFYTEDPKAPWAEAVAISGKELVAVGLRKSA